MVKKILLISGSAIFLSVAAFLMVRIVKDEQNKSAGSQKEFLMEEELAGTKNAEALLDAPVGVIETKSGAQKALSDTDTLMDSMGTDNPTE